MVRSRRGLWAAALAVLSYFASPLAALFLGMILIAVAVLDGTRRLVALVAAGCVIVVGLGMAILFSGTGTMPFAPRDVIPAGVACLVVAALCPDRRIRLVVVMLMVSFPVLLVVPGAVGANITRLAWVCAAPIVAAYGRGPRWLLPVAVVALSVWPTADLVGQLHSGSDPSAQARYYQSVRRELAIERAAAGAPAVGQRVEVVDTANHWGSAYLASEWLARGWDRQADNAYNPIFYGDNTLTADNYHDWLRSLAVGWVAVPAAPLDYASVAEATLIRGGLNYLTLSWSDKDWRLYRVVDSTALASGATVTAVDAGTVTLMALASTPVDLRIRWSPYLSVHDPVTGTAIAACVVDIAGWIRLSLPPGRLVQLSSGYNMSARVSSADSDCVDDLATK